MPKTLAPLSFQAITRANIHQTRSWRELPEHLREALMVVSTVLPFRTNAYVLEELIDWTRVPDDPMFQLNFLHKDMLDAEAYTRMAHLVSVGAPREELKRQADRIRLGLNPHPAGQLTDNVPRLDGRPLAGVQHKYRETVLFFPSAGQTCHAYCSFCFRWPQFVDLEGYKLEARDAGDLVGYLSAHSEVSDLLVTGGDPLVMSTRQLRRYLEPVLTGELEHVVTIRLGTKSLAYWPHRFVTDPDADELLRFFEQVVDSGRHLAVMGHYSHPRELETPMARTAVRRICSTGAQVRMQSPLLSRVNDDPDVWARLWSDGVRLGCVPYYMFVERDTGPRGYFEVPLEAAWNVFRAAYQQVSGLARTVRGPSMSAYPGKVLVDGVARVGGEKVFVLQFLQARDPGWVRRPFFARYDPRATWLDDLEPAFGECGFFFEDQVPLGPPVPLPEEIMV